jgi:hypothetical protein
MRLSLYMKQVLQHFEVVLKDYLQGRDKILMGYQKHIDYLEDTVRDAKSNLEKMKSAKPGDLFLWKNHVPNVWDMNDPGQEIEGIIHFNYFNYLTPQGLNVSFVCGNKGFLKMLQAKRVSGPDLNMYEDLNVHPHRVRDWVKISPKDLPLYVNAEIKSPYFDIQLQRS